MTGRGELDAMWLRAMSYFEDILNAIPAAVLLGMLYCAGRFIWLKKGESRGTAGGTRG